MSDAIVTKVIEIAPTELKLLDQNARFMRRETFAQLVENVKRDGELTQLPFAVLEEDGKYRVLSGNHRVSAAIEAKLPSIKVQVTDQPLSKARRMAIQLSHNAITGEDDPFTLKQLYDSIEDVDMRRYSGLDDVTLGLLENVSMDPIGEAQLDFVPITFLFLPQELEDMKEQFEKASKLIKGDELWIASLSQYDRMVQALHAASKAYGVKNMATALEIVLRTFEAHLTDLQSGAFDVNMEPKHKNPLPIEVVLGVNLIPSGAARTISMAIKKAQKAEPDLKPLDIIERWAKDANAL